ncbi:MAG: iron-sulfur cluster assembly accessory protein [Bacteroidota bacterium]
MTETADAPFGITDRALDRLAAVAASEAVDLGATYLRVAVVPGGCSGLTYDLGWDTALGADDEVVEVEGLRVVLDLKSRLYVEGTTLDFTDGLDGQGFHFDNPQATRTCACGESFSL